MNKHCMEIMATIAINQRKRLRSDESPCSAIQKKIHINQRIVDENDNNKMQQIHAKTIRQLFDGSRQEKRIPSKTPLWQQIVLYGDGRIEFRDIPLDLAADRKPPKCCAGRESFVQEKCNNCALDMCENCGFSCSECGRFLCRSCVALFGCGTTDRPICERCAIFSN